MTPRRSLASPIAIFVLMLVAAFYFVRSNVDSYATSLAQEKVSEFLSGTGFELTFNEAVFKHGMGMEFRQLQFTDIEKNPKKLLTIDSLLVRFSGDWQTLLQRGPQPTAIEINGGSASLDQRWLYDVELKNRLNQLLRKRPNSDHLVPVIVNDLDVDCRAINGEGLVRNVKFNIDVQPQGRRKFIAKMRASGDWINEFDGNISVDLEKNSVSANVVRLIADLDDRMHNMIPVSLRRQSRLFNGVSGLIAVAGIFKYETSTGPKFAVNGKIADLALKNRQLPITISRCGADFFVNQNQLQIKRAKGRIDQSEFEFSYLQHGLFERKKWSARGSLHNGEFRPNFQKYLPDYCQKFCHDFSPTGKFDVAFDANSSGQKEIVARVTDMAFSFYKFPYLMQHCHGDVYWKNNRIDFDIQTLKKEQTVTMSGVVLNPGKKATYRVEFGTDDRLPIDKELFDSLVHYPSIGDAFRDFRPNGFVSGVGVVEKKIPGVDQVERSITIRLHDCIVQHRSFDYVIQQVEGSIEVDPDGFSFRGIRGNSGAGQTTCNGIWNPNEGLQLDFVCRDIDLDERLRRALTTDLKSIWDGFRPRGRVGEGHVKLSKPPGSDSFDVQVSARLRPQTNPVDAVSIFPTWFPYRLDNFSGDFRIGNGEVRLQNVVAEHGHSRFSCHGNGFYTDDRWSVALNNLMAVNIDFDEQLLSALPESLSEGIRHIDYRGVVNFSGQMEFSGDYLSTIPESNLNENLIQTVGYQSVESDVEVGWDLRVDMNRGKMQLGVPIENIFGSIQLSGKSDGLTTACDGAVTVDSLTVHGLQVTHVQGPIWIDNHQTLTGKFVDQRGEGVSLSGRMYDGIVKFDGYVSHDDQYPFYFKTVLEGAQLSGLAPEFQADLNELSGQAFGLLQMKGNANEWHSYVGTGNVHLSDAKIHELPIILSLLKILSIKEVNRTAFDTSNIDFSIEGNQLKFDRIELIGDAISLIGNGYMEIMRHADFNFYSVVGRNRFYIPLVSELYRAGSQRIMWINIGGPLDNMQTTRKVLPGLDDSLRALLEPTNGTTANRFQN